MILSPRVETRVAAWEPRRDTPSSLVVRDFVSAMVAAGLTRRELRLTAKVGPIVERLPRSRWSRISQDPIVVPMMGFQPALLWSASLFGEVVPFCWDVWPSDYPVWEELLSRLTPRSVFMTSRQSAEHFAIVLGETQVKHLSEATNVAAYDASLPLDRRHIDVLELGRRHEVWHAQAKPALSKRKRSHLFERTRGELVFQGSDSMRRGLASAAVSVCFPSAATHPERAGGVSTATHRYFESMASGCLMVGSAPPELVDLVGYNPVVEADLDNAGNQILEILDCLPEWQPLVDANLRVVCERGTWSSRASAIRSVLNESFSTSGGLPAGGAG